MGRSATPLSMAAWATAGAIFIISRGSNGLGIRYSGQTPVLAGVGRRHHFALLGLGQLGNGVHRRNFHLVR
jgi:hypothetical protein